MDRKYTAQEMRIVADRLEEFGCKGEVPAMLRQAADMMERDKKYEYAGKYSNGTVSLLHYECIDPLKSFVDEHHRIVRREVGEWEEVK